MEYRHRSVTRQTGPDFAASLVPNGYAWWYLDAFSDCGRYGLTVIAMLGCVFSPFYARARRGGLVDPLTHSALNVALYTTDPHGPRHWAMTERDLGGAPRHADTLVIGPSRLEWDGRMLTLEIDEREAPWPRRLRGKVRFVPELLTAHALDIDRSGRHRWHPLAPRGRIDVQFDTPPLRWQGTGYLDANQGEAPLEEDFASWEWSRTSQAEQTSVCYDRRWRDSPTNPSPSSAVLAVTIDAAGALHSIDPPPRHRLPRTGWGIERAMRAATDEPPRLVKTLENGPFYARSLLHLGHGAAARDAMHESVSLERFEQRWVQALLPVRTRRG